MKKDNSTYFRLPKFMIVRIEIHNELEKYVEFDNGVGVFWYKVIGFTLHRGIHYISNVIFDKNVLYWIDDDDIKEIKSRTKKYEFSNYKTNVVILEKIKFKRRVKEKEILRFKRKYVEPKIISVNYLPEYIERSGLSSNDGASTYAVTEEIKKCPKCDKLWRYESNLYNDSKFVRCDCSTEFCWICCKKRKNCRTEDYENC